MLGSVVAILQTQGKAWQNYKVADQDPHLLGLMNQPEIAHL